MSVKNKDLMTPYEKRMYDGISKSQADLCKDNEMLVRTAARQLLAVKIPDELATGETVSVPVVSLLLMKKFRYWLEHPEDMDIKALSAITDKMSGDVSTQDASNFFKGIAEIGAVKSKETTHDRKASK